MICSKCKGNGYVRLSFEAEQVIEQCKICHSQGEINEDTTTDHRLIQNVSKTTRFRMSKPVIEFKGEPPF